MARKQELKPTEIRILVLMHHTTKETHYASWISNKLDVDIGHVSRLLKVMAYKGWLDFKKSNKKVFYILTNKTPTLEYILKAIEDAKTKTRHNKLKSLQAQTNL